MGIAQSAIPDASQSRQRRIALTGGIATGKSSVGQLLSAGHGLPLLDADVYAREALAPETAAAHAVQARYGTLNRAVLGQIVFGDANERRWLEQLLHPLVRQRFEAELTRLQAAPVVVLMIPLLFEAGLEALGSEIWLVDCDERQQLQRLMARNGYDDTAALARIAAQWPLARKRPLADVVLDNRGTPAELAAQVNRALAGAHQAH
ncbi:MAG: dephospho-CoA kinase, partial [Cyanobacteria bacterium K_DeepCast_35m_m2_023]|nr:dephospho-CoA kinase [Cyanobacteria bacterium K_DeepCast_35m_m2_023]